jgi:hypothetical protein
VNKRDRDFELVLPERAKQIEYVDQTTTGNPPAKQPLSGNKISLRGLAVAVVTFAPR